MPPRKESAAPASLFVDSGAWIAFFSARDSLHAEADRLIRLAYEQRRPLLTTNLVIAEVHRLLLHRAGAKAAAGALAALDGSRALTIHFADNKTHERAVEWLRKLDDQVISYTDAASFAVMAANRCSAAITFDRDFVVAGFVPWRG